MDEFSPSPLELDDADLDFDDLAPQPVGVDNVFSLRTGVLSNASAENTTLAGNLTETKGELWPPQSKIQFGDFIFLLTPVTPISLRNGVVQLYAEAWSGAAVTIVVGEGQGSAFQNFPTPAGRDIYAECTLGNGNARQMIQVDLTVGMAVRLPTATAEVEFFDESIRPSLDGDPPPPYHRVQATGAATYLPASAFPAQRVQRAWFPFSLGQAQGVAPDVDGLLGLLST